jgi:hypothetical protein
MKQYKISKIAYCKLILHALRFPSQSVLGVLLGSADSDKVNSISQFLKTRNINKNLLVLC